MTDSTAVAVSEPQDQSAVMVSLIQRAATDPAFDLEKLDRLLDVKERWENQEARKAYVTALAAFKRNPPKLVKDQQVDFGEGRSRTRYTYASLGDVASQVATRLAEHGLSHGWDIEQSQAIGQLPGMVTVTCTLTHEWGHGESVSITAPRDDTGNKNSIQQIGSAITYLERYTLMAITGLAAHDQDDDGQGAAARPSQPQPRQQARPRQPRREAPKPEPTQNPAPEPDTSTVEAPAQPEQYITTAESCTCADFQYRGKERPCKHITRLASAEEPFGVAGPAMPDPGAQDFGLANVGELMAYANKRWGSTSDDILGALGCPEADRDQGPERRAPAARFAMGGQGVAMDTDMRDAVEAGFVEAYSDHQEALLEIRRRGRWALYAGWFVWGEIAEETLRKLDLSREQVKALWS